MARKVDPKLEALRTLIKGRGPGPYVLCHNVLNPRPDGRRKYDWDAREVFSTGERFLVTYEDHFQSWDEDDDGYAAMKKRHDEDPFFFCTIKFEREGKRGTLTVTRSTWNRAAEIVDEMFPYMEPAEETAETVLRVRDAEDWAASHVAEVLVKAGKITLDDLKEAVDAEIERWEKGES
jgi:hypothetical protein